ncbi:glycerol-3-phosphate acyltransferase 1, mitochondrial-like isoform X2 [Pomacea canaliculata]|uniref:glycerol-3-phosphate acyltransferase 1, mitochondrial-like isoform X2 n=1 Tax=Pomacea canaliculata TaxID=400727 RepID=UPI000D735FAA|nr:glycerol-3-phosphate acyltransferase 1, mitochondrial-like isoform X2 [Pomacea canaliculata]
MPAQFTSQGSLHHGRQNPKRKRATISNELQFDTNLLASFKFKPFYKPEDFKVNRILMGQCCSCLPDSRHDFCDPNTAEHGMRNILDVKPELGDSSPVVMSFDKLAYSLRRPLFGPFPDLSVAVLTNPRVVDAVQRAAWDLGSEDNFSVMEKRASRIINKMKASVSAAFIRFTGWFLLKFLSVILHSVLVHKGQMAVLKKAADRGLPMIYLPLHRSHLDYVLVTFILWNYDIRAPHVAAGDNMDIPFFSLLMRSLGGFFIRRQLDNGSTDKDILYRAILNTYMLELLKRGESLEFFIEGGRTRTGRAIRPKGGLLSVVADACSEGIIPDAYVVPINISYDKLLEGNFCKEQMGQPKERESFRGACRALFKVLCGDFGSVRVDFAHPFSVQEFIKSSKNFPAQNLFVASTLQSSESTVSCPAFSQPLVSNSNNSPDIIEGNRMVVRALAEHTVFTCVSSLAPMCSHMLAFLLLTKFRQGASLESLADAMQWLKEELAIRNQDVGFCGKPQDVILYAQNLLGEEAVACSVKTDEEVFLTPTLTLPTVFELSYNASSITSTFALESILAIAVIAEAGLHPGTWTDKQCTEPTINISQDTVLETAHKICDLLHTEFIFVPPCKKLQDVLIEKFEDFVLTEVLLEEESQDTHSVNPAEKQWAARISKNLSWDDEEDEDSRQPCRAHGPGECGTCRGDGQVEISSFCDGPSPGVISDHCLSPCSDCGGDA